MNADHPFLLREKHVRSSGNLGDILVLLGFPFFLVGGGRKQHTHDLFPIPFHWPLVFVATTPPSS